MPDQVPKVQIQNIDKKSMPIRIRVDQPLGVWMNEYARKRGISKSRAWREAAEKLRISNPTGV